MDANLSLRVTSNQEVKGFDTVLHEETGYFDL